MVTSSTAAGRASAQRSGTPVLGYVIRMFPKVSETFIANEILALERLGVPLRIYSYRRPREAVPHQFVRLIQSPITYLPDPLNRHPLRLLRANLALYRREPERYRRTFLYVLRYTLRERNPDTWRRFLQAVCLAELVTQSDVQRLHAHFAHGPTRVAMLASMLTGLPFGFTAHAFDIYHNVNTRLLREKIEAADIVVTCSRANQEHLQRLVGPAQRDKIKANYHGVDVGKFTPAAESAPGEPPLILSVGRLVKKKGFPDLLRACAALKDKGYPFRCEIFGDGPERARLRALVSTLRLGDVVSLRGTRSQEELVGVYRQATAFALPCKVLKSGDRDGIPNVLLEAMAVGLPVVASAVSGIPELVRSGHNGLLVAERDGPALAAALELLLQDGELRQRLGQNARRTVEQEFDAVTNAGLLAALFRERHAAARV